jgi:hypothetical protein
MLAPLISRIRIFRFSVRRSYYRIRQPVARVSTPTLAAIALVSSGSGSSVVIVALAHDPVHGEFETMQPCTLGLNIDENVSVSAIALDVQRKIT